MEGRKLISKNIWSTEEIGREVQEKKEANLKWICTKSYENRQEYVAKRNKVNRLVTAAKREVFDRKCN